eukprot:2920663-Rhodomonas_salina.1
MADERRRRSDLEEEAMRLKTETNRMQAEVQEFERNVSKLEGEVEGAENRILTLQTTVGEAERKLERERAGRALEQRQTEARVEMLERAGQAMHDSIMMCNQSEPVGAAESAGLGFQDPRRIEVWASEACDSAQELHREVEFLQRKLAEMKSRHEVEAGEWTTQREVLKREVSHVVKCLETAATENVVSASEFKRSVAEKMRMLQSELDVLKRFVKRFLITTSNSMKKMGFVIDEAVEDNKRIAYTQKILLDRQDLQLSQLEDAEMHAKNTAETLERAGERIENLEKSNLADEISESKAREQALRVEAEASFERVTGLEADVR